MCKTSPYSRCECSSKRSAPWSYWTTSVIRVNKTWRIKEALFTVTVVCKAWRSWRRFNSSETVTKNIDPELSELWTLQLSQLSRKRRVICGQSSVRLWCPSSTSSLSLSSIQCLGAYMRFKCLMIPRAMTWELRWGILLLMAFLGRMIAARKWPTDRTYD